MIPISGDEHPVFDLCCDDRCVDLLQRCIRVHTQGTKFDFSLAEDIEAIRHEKGTMETS